MLIVQISQLSLCGTGRICLSPNIHCTNATTHLALRIGFARLDNIRTAARVQLKAMRLITVLNLTHLRSQNENEKVAKLPLPKSPSIRFDTHRNVLQRNDAPRLLVRRILEIIQTIVVQNEPAAFP